MIGRSDLVKKYEALAGTTGDADFTNIQKASEKEGKVSIKQNHAVYAAMVEAMDQAVGTVIAELKASGKWDNAIIVFTSDNEGLSTSEGLPTSNLPLYGGKG